MKQKILHSILYICIGLILLAVNANKVGLGITESGMITIVRVYAVVGFVMVAISAIFKKK